MNPAKGFMRFNGQRIEPPPPSRWGMRYVLYDREPVGLTQNSCEFFTQIRETYDGRPKTSAFTNMTQCGQLGVPVSMALSSIAVYPVAGDDQYLEDFDKFAKSDAVLRFVAGMNTVVLSKPMALMGVVAVAERFYRDSVTGEACYVSIEDGTLSVQKVTPVKEFPLEGLFADRGSPRYTSLLTPNGDMRYLDSCDAFRAEIAWRSAKPIDVYVCLDGILFAPC